MVSYSVFNLSMHVLVRTTKVEKICPKVTGQICDVACHIKRRLASISYAGIIFGIIGDEKHKA